MPLILSVSSREPGFLICAVQSILQPAAKRIQLQMTSVLSPCCHFFILRSHRGTSDHGLKDRHPKALSRQLGRPTEAGGSPQSCSGWFFVVAVRQDKVDQLSAAMRGWRKNMGGWVLLTKVVLRGAQRERKGQKDVSRVGQQGIMG